jgi:hypothetical protein
MWKPHTLLVGTQNGSATQKKARQFPKGWYIHKRCAGDKHALSDTETCTHILNVFKTSDT